MIAHGKMYGIYTLGFRSKISWNDLPVKITIADSLEELFPGNSAKAYLRKFFLAKEIWKTVKLQKFFKFLVTGGIIKGIDMDSVLFSLYTDKHYILKFNLLF